ncbi:MAG: TonB-dependent receptor [Proteobacteria bacterium]|nr:TonB-dependent receptor [Pseudomonadota bacterium]
MAGIEVVATSSRHEARTHSGDDGGFEITDLVPGMYRVGLADASFGGSAIQVNVTDTTATVRLVIPGEVIEITEPYRSEGDRLRESARAARVIDTVVAGRQSADLGEVMARVEGVSIRRVGGLGSDARLSLAGLGGGRVRVFLDGVPLEVAGLGMGVANVPVGLVDRVDVYRGVVPVRLGVDALGGAVELVSKPNPYGTSGELSYQAGSFGSHRLAGHAAHRSVDHGLVLRASGFVDRAENDYSIDVEVPDSTGRLRPTRVRRFHDGYRAEGGSLVLAHENGSQSQRVAVRVFGARHEKDIQHNVAMTVPYGEVVYDKFLAGIVTRYERRLGGGVELEGVAGYARTVTGFRDLSSCSYDWYGACVRQRPSSGEIGTRPLDYEVRDHSGFVRLHAGGPVTKAHKWSLSVAPTYAYRIGNDRTLGDQSFDPFTARQRLLTYVAGAELASASPAEAVQNIAFVKSYGRVAVIQRPLIAGGFTPLDRNLLRFGVGDGLRVRFLKHGFARASYEWATRLPSPAELFGDGVLVVDNLELTPEVSHNINLEVGFDSGPTRAGSLRVTATAFGRFVEDLIVRLSNDQVMRHDNVYGARSIGFEGFARWTSPGNHLVIEANATWMSLRNTSDEGPFAAYYGDRVPNQPYQTANGSVRLQSATGVVDGDLLSVAWFGRYVGAFFRSWESIGRADTKLQIDAQVVHSAVLTYHWESSLLQLALSIEAHNLFDRRVYDYFGVQRPGRALFSKLSLQL